MVKYNEIREEAINLFEQSKYKQLGDLVFDELLTVDTVDEAVELPLVQGLCASDPGHVALCNSMVLTNSRERPVQALFRSYPAPFLDIKESRKSGPCGFCATACLRLYRHENLHFHSLWNRASMAA